MNYKNIDDIDLKLGLLSGSAISVDNINITPYKLSEIKDFGYVKYIDNLKWVSASINDFIESITDDDKRLILEEQKKNLKTFDFYIKLGGQGLQDKLLKSLAMIFRTDDVQVLDNGVVAINFMKMGILYEDDDGNMLVDNEILGYYRESDLTIIHRENFDDIIEVVKLQNYLTKPVKKEDNTANPIDEETRKLIEDMERHRKNVESKKNAQKKIEGNEEIDISDIVSAVSSKSNSINKINIWDLTLYQIYDEYSRLELIDSYEFSIKAIMAGAKDIDLTHWSSKL